MLSSKISMDDTYSNKSWQVVGQGLFELREVNQMERELFAFLGWNVVVRDEELAAWVEDVVGDYLTLAQGAGRSTEDRKRRRETTNSHPTPSSSTIRSTSPEEQEARHRRASDAAVALLHGPSTSPTSSAINRPRRSRSPTYTTSTCDQSDCSSSSSSSLSSPISGSTTPGSPGPLTPLDGSPPSSWIKGQDQIAAISVGVVGW